MTDVGLGRPSKEDVEDWVLAVVVALIGQLDVLLPHLFSTGLSGPLWAVSLLYAAASLALVARRRHPLATVVFVGLILVVQALVFGASRGNGAFFPALIAVYSVAAHGSRCLAYWALAGIPVVLLVRETHNPGNVNWAATRAALMSDAVVVAAWLAGAWMAERRRFVHSLIERAEQVEQAREREAAAALEKERARIARDLHDSIAHSLTAMVVQAEAADDVFDRDPEGARGAVQRIADTGRRSLLEMRHVVGSLRAAGTAAAGTRTGVAGITDLVAAAGQAGLVPHLMVAGSAQVPDGPDQAAYRVVQEALTNVLRHSRCRDVDVAVDYRDDLVDVWVADRGPASRRWREGGPGLIGMRERVDLCGGVLEAGPTASGGFRVHAIIPTRGSA